VPSLVPGTHLVNHHGDTEVAEVVERTAAFVLSVVLLRFARLKTWVAGTSPATERFDC